MVRCNKNFSEKNSQKITCKIFSFSFSISFFKFHAVAAIKALICSPFSPPR